MDKAPAKGDGSLRKVALVGSCLICMFVGAWTCDYSMLSLVAFRNGYLPIRAFSFVAYLLAFLIACLGLRGGEKAALDQPRSQRALELALGCGCLLLAIGSIGLVFFAGKSGALPMLCVFLVKAVGPPLTIAVLVLLAKLPFDAASKTAALSMALAFLIEFMLRLVFASASAGEGVALLLGATCQIAGCLGALVLMHRFARLAKSKEAGELSPVPSSAQTLPSALCEMRPRCMWGQTTGRSLLIIVATSLMLGYVRTGASSKGVVEAVAVIVVFVALGLAVRFAPKLNARTLLAAAIACVSAAFLLDPFLSIADPDVGSTLADVGTILFEINIWIMSIAFARSCHRPVLAAAGVRLAAVTGHLAGALIAAGSSAIMGSHPEASQAAPLVIVFIYVVLLLVLYRDGATYPSAGFPIGEEGLSAAGRSADIAGGVGGVGSAGIAGGAGTAGNAAAASSADATGDWAYGDEYWKGPCRSLADEFGLTPRETEVLEQLAQGRDLAFMEEKFVISRNTVKMHVRNIYAKLGVHSKQEVIDLVEQTRQS